MIINLARRHSLLAYVSMWRAEWRPFLDLLSTSDFFLSLSWPVLVLRHPFFALKPRASPSFLFLALPLYVFS